MVNSYKTLFKYTTRAKFRFTLERSKIYAFCHNPVDVPWRRTFCSISQWVLINTNQACMTGHSLLAWLVKWRDKYLKWQVLFAQQKPSLTHLSQEFDYNVLIGAWLRDYLCPLQYRLEFGVGFFLWMKEHILLLRTCSILTVIDFRTPSLFTKLVKVFFFINSHKKYADVF